MDDDIAAFGIGAVIVVAVVGGFIWLATNRPTTYCTEWVKAVSITPTNSDNGKYSDEQYIVKYEDGSIMGQDEGLIPFARCTAQTRVHHSKKQPGWKEISNYSGVNWGQ